MEYYNPLNAGLVCSARDMARSPFFHRSHSSAFCAAVNNTRDVNMAHLLIS
jgi:hypothetical protein